MKTGVIRIGLFNSISVHYLPPILKVFVQAYPGVEVELLQGNYQEVENWVWEGRVDCGFVCLPVQKELEVIELMKDPLRVITSRDHPFSKKERLSLLDMKEEFFILDEGEADPDFKHLFRKAGFLPRVKFVTENDYATIAMVKQGLGISLLPELIVRDFKDEVCVKKMEFSEERTIAIALRSIEKVSPVTKAFIEFLKGWTK